ncbi:hypothetical protein GCM10023257_43800 [Streptomyces hyderabadensis]|uniref:Uncharacterized protein n=1 Tax=Streptomyces hyderabadensis TaxID=598549 RepID=A0ABP9IFG2_9ACTN
MSAHTDGSGSGACVSSGAELLGDGDAGADVVVCESSGAGSFSGVPSSSVALGDAAESGVPVLSGVPVGLLVEPPGADGGVVPASD